MRKSFTGCCALLAALSFGASAPAIAAPQWCSGAVYSSWIEASGAVYISSSWHNGNHTQICNIRSEWKSIPVDVCVAWVAKMDAAATLGKVVTVYYGDAPACDALPTYGSAPAPSYVMILNS